MHNIQPKTLVDIPIVTYGCPYVILFTSSRERAKPLQEVDNMEEDKGMTRDELEELKAALLKAERLEIMMILREAKSLEEAYELIKQR